MTTSWWPIGWTLKARENEIATLKNWKYDWNNCQKGRNITWNSYQENPYDTQTCGTHTLQGKGNLYDFYHLLLQKTNNANVSDAIISKFVTSFSWAHKIIAQYHYKEIHWVFRIWRTLMTLKHVGHRHDLKGIGNMPPGSLTIKCPACPHPGWNLLENWKDAGPFMCVEFFLLSPCILRVSIHVPLYFVHLSWCQLQAEGKGVRVRGSWVNAWVGSFCQGITVSRFHCKLHWSAWSGYVLFLSRLQSGCSHLDQYVWLQAWCYCQGSDMVPTGLCCLWHWDCHLFQTSSCVKEGSWQPSQGQKLKCFSSIKWFHD